MRDATPMWRRYLRFFGADANADLDDELEFHLEELIDELMARGATPDAARHEARRRLGDLRSIKGELAAASRMQQRRERLRNAWRNLQHSVRRLRRAPAFTATALATLTLGIGASVAMFTVVDTVIFRPLPYPEPDRIVRLSPTQNFNMAFADALGEAPDLTASSGVSGWSLTLTGNGTPAVLNVQAVDAEFFNVVGVQPILGRPFSVEDRDPGLSDIVILSYGVWQTRFGGDPSVIGWGLDLDGSGHASRTVVGVMPERFAPPLSSPAAPVSAWIPLSRAAGRTIATDSTWYVNNILGRLTPDATVEQAAAQVRTITARMREAYPGRVEEERLETAGAIRLLDSMVGGVRTSLLALLGAVGLVMLLACVNLANLLLARGDRLRREVAVRAALGAGRMRLVREQLTDSIVLAVLGGGAGIILARVLLTTLDLSRAASLPRTSSMEMDWRVLAFALSLSLIAAIAFGLGPALRVSRSDLRDGMGSGSRTPSVTRAGARLGALLVAGEIALATVLVTGAGLLLKSMQELRSVDVGLDASDVIAIKLAPPEARYEGASARILYDQVFERLRAIPGVNTVGGIHLLPLTFGNWGFPYLAEGHLPPDGPLPSANFRVVTPDYFETVDQSLIEGRFIEEADRQTERLTVGVINRAMAEELWPDERAIGKTIRLFGSVPFEVVGVVSNVRQFTLDRESVAEMYVPHGAGWSLSSLEVLLEVSGDPRPIMAAAREAVWAVDRNIPIVSMRPMQEVVSESVARQRFFATVLSFFGVLALTLGSVGVFGVMAYTMGARRTEFGIRMALGATRARVLGGAFGRGAIAIAIGLTAGVVASAAAGRLLESLLFGVRPGDPGTQLAAGLVLAAVAIVATFLPAYRATSIDAATVMRAD